MHAGVYGLLLCLLDTFATSDRLAAVQIFQRLVVLLGSDANVVHTYAAVAVERLLAQKVRLIKSSTCQYFHSPLTFTLDKVHVACLVWVAFIAEMPFTAQEGGQQRFQVQDLAPLLEPLLSALFSAFNKPDSAENEYVMRCIMRVIGFVGPEVIF